MNEYVVLLLVWCIYYTVCFITGVLFPDRVAPAADLRPVEAAELLDTKPDMP